jgi:ribosomal-protein-alanine N-acetyltransferase
MTLADSPLPRLARPALLRRLRASDLAAFHAYRSDPAVCRYQAWSPMSEAEASEFIAEMETAPLCQPGQWAQVAIARAEDDALVGDMGLLVAEDLGLAEIGFTLSTAARGRGYAAAAAAAAIQLLFELTAVPRVVGITDARNAASVRVLERVGMSRVEAREVVFKGEPCVEWVYSIGRGS